MAVKLKYSTFPEGGEMNLQELKDLTRGIDKVVTEATNDPGMRAAMTTFLMHKCLGESVMSTGVRDELIKCGKKVATKHTPKKATAQQVAFIEPGQKRP